MSVFDEVNQRTIDEFRANAGVVGGLFENKPLRHVRHAGSPKRIACLSCDVRGGYSM